MHYTDRLLRQISCWFLEMNHLGKSFQKSVIIFINEDIAFLRISDIN